MVPDGRLCFEIDRKFFQEAVDSFIFAFPICCARGHVSHVAFSCWWHLVLWFLGFSNLFWISFSWFGQHRHQQAGWTGTKSIGRWAESDWRQFGWKVSNHGKVLLVRASLFWPRESGDSISHVRAVVVIIVRVGTFIIKTIAPVCHAEVLVFDSDSPEQCSSEDFWNRQVTQSLSESPRLPTFWFHRYNALLSSRQQQNRWVRDYTDELIMLQRDVDNVRRINETIPRTCFGTITLEPTDPTG